ncbi:HAD family hydrolase [Formosa sp. PL04]|uniref:HAD family hydrolase n=1 Tax=Formosa sp. PL04 TaxID=3081755 RepID=UPI00298133F2|nr:HAD family hydrolase [Formosa sp. PL04]MDW5289135.1 HAD family hydrolase [Formosa sp. PL04]
MKYAIKSLAILIMSCIFLISCNQKTENKVEGAIEDINNDIMTDALPSWNEGENKSAIIEFVEDVTNQDSNNYIPVTDRIATFDNDGTLWSEKPLYTQLLFAFDRIKTLAPEHPEWKTTQPYKAVLENDEKALLESGEKGLFEILAVTHAGDSTVDFETIVTNWIATTKQPDPRFKDRLFTDMVFQPMLELMDYLRANDFEVFIVSGGGIEFMRPWTENAYGVPTQNIVGSSIKVSYEYRDGKPVLMRLPKIEFIDDKDTKPAGINAHIGKKPVFSFGNSSGDQEMLEWSQSAGKKTFQGLVHHTDAKREWAYGPDSKIGTFPTELITIANTRGWHVVDMKSDWNVIFPFDLN